MSLSPAQIKIIEGVPYVVGPPGEDGQPQYKPLSDFLSVSHAVPPAALVSQQEPAVSTTWVPHRDESTYPVEYTPAHAVSRGSRRSVVVEPAAVANTPSPDARARPPWGSGPGKQARLPLRQASQPDKRFRSLASADLGGSSAQLLTRTSGLAAQLEPLSPQRLPVSVLAASPAAAEVHEFVPLLPAVAHPAAVAALRAKSMSPTGAMPSNAASRVVSFASSSFDAARDSGYEQHDAWDPHSSIHAAVVTSSPLPRTPVMPSRKLVPVLNRAMASFSPKSRPHPAELRALASAAFPHTFSRLMEDVMSSVRDPSNVGEAFALPTHIASMLTAPEVVSTPSSPRESFPAHQQFNDDDDAEPVPYQPVPQQQPALPEPAEVAPEPALLQKVRLLISGSTTEASPAGTSAGRTLLPRAQLVPPALPPLNAFAGRFDVPESKFAHLMSAYEAVKALSPGP